MTNGAKFDMIQGELNGRRVILLPGHEVIRMPSAGFKTPAPADYTGALSELLPQLIEKYRPARRSRNR